MTLQEQRDALAVLGDPDESWSTDDLPLVTDAAVDVPFGPRIALDNAIDKVLQIATDRDGLERLAALVDTDEDRRTLLEVDPETHAALLIQGVADAARITYVRLRELAVPPGRDPKYLLDLAVEGVRWIPGVIAIIDKLPLRPTEAVLRPADGRGSHTRLGVSLC
jgi:hypothetical protein